MNRDAVRMMNPLTMAFVGDAVQELYVKAALARRIDASSHVLQDRSVQYLCCEAQARAARAMEDFLDDEERAVYRRARNAKIATMPRHATAADYHAATAIEAVLGYRYLLGDAERTDALLRRLTALCDGKTED